MKATWAACPAFKGGSKLDPNANPEVWGRGASPRRHTPDTGAQARLRMRPSKWVVGKKKETI